MEITFVVMDDYVYRLIAYMLFFKHLQNVVWKYI